MNRKREYQCESFKDDMYVDHSQVVEQDPKDPAHLSSKTQTNQKKSSGDHTSSTSLGRSPTNKYQDHSRLEINIESKKKSSFPSKLHAIVSNPGYQHAIRWLPHGRSWCIINPSILEKEIIPRHFRHAKLSSFIRQVNGWGFHRNMEEPYIKSYYHEVRLLLICM